MIRREFISKTFYGILAFLTGGLITSAHCVPKEYTVAQDLLLFHQNLDKKYGKVFSIWLGVDYHRSKKQYYVNTDCIIKDVISFYQPPPMDEKLFQEEFIIPDDVDIIKTYQYFQAIRDGKST